MPDDTTHLPAEQLPSLASLVPLSGLPVALQIFFDQSMFERCKSIARYMADAKGFIPAHLAGNPSACFAVMSRALTWKLDPFAVAQACYEVNGKVGYYGSLCQAIIESSGRIEGGIKFRHYGDWSKVMRKFKMVDNERGRGQHPEPNWPAEAEDGLGVEVSAQLRGEAEPRTLEFDLAQAYPRNSVLWATDPKTQIQYTAVRRFANTVAPTLFMGVPFDREDINSWADGLKDVTPPRPRREEFANTTINEESTSPDHAKPEPFVVVDFVGEAVEFDGAEAAAEHLQAAQDEAEKQRGDIGVQAIWESNGRFIYELRDRGHDDIADELAAYYAGRLAEAKQLDTQQNRPGVSAPSTSERKEKSTESSKSRPPETTQAEPQDEHHSARAREAVPDAPQGNTAPARVLDTGTADAASPPAGVANSLAVEIRKERGRPTDWPGTADDMIAKIETLAALDDVAGNGRFKADNREALNLMRTGDKQQWSRVEYAIGSRWRELNQAKPG